MERMTPYERLRAAFRREEPDRVPVFPMLSKNCANLASMSLSEYATDARKMAEAHKYYYNRLEPEYRPDIISVWSDTYLTAEAMGAKVALLKGDEPRLLEHPLASPKKPEDINNLNFPNPYKDGRWHVILEAISILKKTSVKNSRIGSCIMAPFTLCGILRGEQNLIMDLVENPDGVHEMMEYSMPVILEIAKALRDVEAGCALAEPTATLISPSHFDEFVSPYLKKLSEAYEKERMHVWLHMCGRSSHLLERLAETGVGAISVDENVDIGDVKRRIGDKVVVVGNVNPSNTMARGTPDNVIREARACIRKAASGSGYILSTGCECPVGTPFENLRALMIAAEKYGKYPIET